MWTSARIREVAQLQKTTHTSLKRLLVLSLMTAFALVMFLIEAQFPLPVGIAGIKLGLSNLVTLFLLAEFSVRDATAVLLLRIFLGNLLTGQVLSLSYSLAGGLLSLAAMALLCRLLHSRSLWFVSIMGGVFHNAGQLLVAFFVLGTGGVLYYAPFLLVSGILTGILIGITTGLLREAWHQIKQ